MLKQQSANVAPALLSLDGIAALCSVSKRTSEKWHAMKLFGEPVKVPGSGKLVRYRTDSVLKVIEQWGGKAPE
jgi:hypothetical protein